MAKCNVTLRDLLKAKPKFFAVTSGLKSLAIKAAQLSHPEKNLSTKKQSGFFFNYVQHLIKMIQAIFQDCNHNVDVFPRQMTVSQVFVEEK